MASRTCFWCEGAISEDKRRGTKYCSSKCRSAGKSREYRKKNPTYIRSSDSVKAYRGREAKKVKRRRERLNRYKEKKGCIQCGYNVSGLALQFDHRQPGLKHRDVSSLVAGSLSKLFEEIRKCDILCANCHMIKSFS